MTSRKSAAKRQSPERAAEPRASRPQIPPEYGFPKSKKGLLPWSHVTERMASAPRYWVCTVSPEGHPHATPVDGLWLDDRLYFGGSPRTRRNRHLAENPAVCIHLESSDDVLILEGEARLSTPDDALAMRLAEASARKYGYAPKPEDYQAGGVHEFRPRVAFAWTQLVRDATRWEIPPDGTD